MRLSGFFKVENVEVNDFIFRHFRNVLTSGHDAITDYDNIITSQNGLIEIMGILPSDQINVTDMTGHNYPISYSENSVLTAVPTTNVYAVNINNRSFIILVKQDEETY